MESVYKPRWQTKGEGYSDDHNTWKQLSSESVYVRRKGIKIAQNSVHVVCTRPGVHAYG